MSSPVDLSVLVPTYARPDLVARLLERLDQQTLAPQRFEVILVDDGSPEPVQVDPSAHAYSVELLRQANAGPASARNLGLERCRAPLTLILNDDAVPADDLLETHLAVHGRIAPGMAVLGTFQFTERAREYPFVQMLAQTNLLFDFTQLVPHTPLPWSFFWTCNLSLSTELLRSVGGFDAERFPDAIVEDVELGYRLEQQHGLKVWYAPEAVAWHDHVLSPTSYFERAQRLGVNLARMEEKHKDPQILWFTECTSTRTSLANLQGTFESFYATSQKLIAQLEAGHTPGRILSRDDVDQMGRIVRQLSTPWMLAGILEHREGSRARAVLERGPTEARLTSIIVVTREALDQTRRCLEALRRASDARHPTELLFVDNGSTDGTAEYLEQQPDVTLIRNGENLGAPHARNQAIPHARGEQVVFMDSDVMVTAGWLRRLLFHAEVDARSGVVGCLCDRAAHAQQLDYTGPDTPEALDAFARERADTHPQKFRFQELLTSFLVLVRREVLDEIGGFDERFTPWGFEDDDFSLRAHLAGFRNRVALDVFVRHEGYGGKKAERHAGLLERNWTKFAEKWGAPGADYGDYKQFGRLAEAAADKAQLWIPPSPSAISPASIQADVKSELESPS